MKNIAVIFDMDGVLVNSMKYVFDSLNILVGKHGHHINPNDYTLYMGINTKRLQELFKQQFNIEYELEELSKNTTELQIELIKKNEKPSPYLISFLEELKDNNIPTGIGTSSPRNRAINILKAIDLLKYFNVIVDGDEITNHKPNPETFLKVATSLNTPPQNCIVFEDAKNGVQAAKNGNMKVIAIKTEFQTEKDLKDADMIIDSFKEIDLEKIETLYRND